MNAIEIQNLAKRFGPKAALNGVSLNVEQGQIFGFLGPNGAGKSTTIRCLMDYLRPDEGHIKVFDCDAQRQSLAVKKLVGYMPADNHLYGNWNAARHVAFAQKVWGPLPQADELMRRLQLDPKIKSKHLSTGNHQKLGLVLALVRQPKLLVLDEPTRGLDPLLQHEFETIIKKYRDDGGTVFISSHNLSEVEHLCDQIGIIKDGQMVANQSMADIRAMKVHLVTITLGKAIDPAKLDIGEAEIVHAEGDQLIAKVHGDINPLLRHLSKQDVKDIEITHLPLEEIFLGFYQQPQGN